MAAFMDTRILLRKIKDLRCLTPRRNRVKAKWAGSQPKYPATNLALQNFDATYSLQLREQWPSVRVSMLCEQKYGALVNNFATPEGVIADLQSQGCRDFVSQPVGGGALERLQAPGFPPHDNSSTIESVGVSQDVAPPHLSTNIKCFVFPGGDISRFKPSRPDLYGMLGYYLMDAASVLPALALDVQEGHTVLDVCAAPGGKTLALLQTQAIRFMCVNDISVSRTYRLQRVLNSYVPKELLTEERMRITSFDGRKWGEIERDTFDRVLPSRPSPKIVKTAELSQNPIHPLAVDPRHGAGCRELVDDTNIAESSPVLIAC
ncbi:unnamed protein product [Coregonus sp. 'balchen']|nr:unnamed protein product [Coregonus sp. 'balchen']